MKRNYCIPADLSGLCPNMVTIENLSRTNTSSDLKSKTGSVQNIVLFSLPFILLLVQIVFAGVNASAPNTLSFNGRLVNQSTGINVNGFANFTGKIYNAASGGTALFTEDYNNTFVDRGVFSLLIGKTSGVNVSGVDTSNRIRLVEDAIYVNGTCSAESSCVASANCPQGFTVFYAGEHRSSATGCDKYADLLDGSSGICAEEHATTCLGTTSCATTSTASAASVGIICVRVGGN